ncbi:hypothetical protein GB864_14455 [Agromyces sp. MMS17-SY077]|uniref:Carbohydrate kinase PfkB domain-containing protein n=1 Tax=Agromyces seonyuensis TaxID=2662446 RepID=A0A6I4NZK4_9MICO|nr:hypothetical protein [Agromyces seonyuensis]
MCSTDLATGHGLAGDTDPAAFGRLVARARAAGALVVAATGSAGWLADRGTAPFETAFGAASLVFANLAEGRALTGLGPEHPPADVLAALAARFPDAVLTLGADGALAAGTRGAAQIEPERVDALDPTGAGDAFAAGFLAAWVAGASAQEALGSGAALARRCIGRLGGRPE